MKRKVSNNRLQAYSKLAKAILHQWELDGRPLDFYSDVKELYQGVINMNKAYEDRKLEDQTIQYRAKSEEL